MAAKIDDVSGLTVLPKSKKNDVNTAKNWKSTEKGIVFEKETCRLTKKSKIAAIFFGFAMAGCLVGGLYLGGVFSCAPELADALEGEADIETNDGGKEVYNIKVDFHKKIVQLTFISQTHGIKSRKRRDTDEENPSVNFTKTVIQDYKNKRLYFIVPGKNGTTKCLRSKLEGEMIPRDLLKHARNEEIPTETKGRVAQRLRFADDSEADVLVPSANETQNLVYRGNGWNISMHSRRESELNLTDVTNYTCFEYEQTTNKIEDAFYSSEQAKYVVENLSELHQQKLRSISAAFNSTDLASNTSQSHSRHRRNIMEKLSRWSHGNWCGAYTGGYENHCGKVNRDCKAPYNKVHDACKRCNPVTDEIDAYCMEHDRCLLEHGPGPSACVPQGNRCSCDFQLVLGAAVSAMQCAVNGKSECVKAAASITLLFRFVLSCWFPTNICFPSVKIVCGCSACSCPSLTTTKICVPFKFCVPFGSGKIPW